ncbi:MAG TPA: pyridoxal phosphate-dependent aminotransferase family protein [Candidatus Eisenbacteria bacterium]|nr:pyridoxal phosphate-dependent aminotransferase family protein [Candidatus Eisenbacteria bacterium]
MSVVSKRVDLFQKCFGYTRAREAMAAGVYPYYIPIEGSTDTEVMVHGKKLIMVGSNNYLGLTHHPKVMEAAAAATERYGTGCTGSRLLNGTLDIHEKLESDLAEFVGHEASIIYSTGYQANLGAISALISRDDVILIDKLDHASIVDGCTMARGETLRFRHNDIADLEAELDVLADKPGGRLVAVDGVFSMEGDIAPIPQLVETCKKYEARLFVDEAHSLGVIGPTGAGAMDHYGMKGKADLIMGTFSKSFACVGGFIAGDEAVIHYLRHHSRSLMFSAAMPPGAVATVAACLDIIKNEPERRTRLAENARYLRDGIRALGYETGPTETPIVPVIIGSLDKTLAFWRLVMDEGIFTNAVVPPAVPPNACRLRTSCTATHTREQLDQVLEAFRRVGRKLRSMA